MKISFYHLIFYVFAGISCWGQHDQKHIQIASELVFSEVQEHHAIAIYKRDSKKIPYFIKGLDCINNKREFYIIQYISDFYNYLIVEKKGGEVLYYPLTWSDLDAIDIKEIYERVRDILNGNILRTSKNNL